MSNPKNSEELQKQYLFEKELAEKLKNSSKDERKNLYSQIYNDFENKKFETSPPQNTSKKVNYRLKLVKKFTDPTKSLIEIGAGNCNFAIEIAKYVKNVIAIDVIDSPIKETPENYKYIRFDGFNIPTEPKSIDIAISDQVMEHIHEDDALDQLKNIYNCIKDSGKYICFTPNKTTGPWDISRHFDNEATGLHLKEYTYQEMSTLLKKVGFKKSEFYIGFKGHYLKAPTQILILLEKLFSKIPDRLRKFLAEKCYFRILFGINVIAKK